MFEEIRDTAVSVTCNVFETMLFTFIEPRNGEEGKASFQPSADLLRGEIGFSGRVSGTLRLTLPMGLAKRMASNFMGLEEESTESQAADLVNELCNMICGNLSCRLDRGVMWRLTIPKTRTLSPEEKEDETGQPTVAVDFDAEGERVNLSIRLLSAPLSAMGLPS